MEYDVIIVGAGPAGTITAYHLARAGFHVLILEKEKLPRYKSCAGAVAARTLDIIDFDISPVLERSVYRVCFTHKFGRGRLMAAESPLAYMVMRDKLDYLLTEKAVQAGAEVLQEAEVTDIHVHSDGAIVSAAGQQFHGKIAVGADGSGSVVAKILKLSSARRLVVTVQGEVSVDASTMTEHGSRMWVDIGSVPFGYAWLFPKAHHLSVGIGTLQKRARGLKDYFWRCLKAMVPRYQSIQVYVHPLAVWGGEYKLAGNRVILVGDAAGITDPLTGEGIYYAVRSGIIAAQVIGRCLSQSQYDMAEYELAIRSRLGHSLQTAVKLSALFYAFPRATHRFILCNDKITTYFSEMMQNSEERDYMGLWTHGLVGL
jgi:geranylgeranyl reductase family protein